MDKKTAALKRNIEELDSQIEAEEKKAAALRRRAKLSTGEDAQKELLDDLKTKVRGVYETCGFDAESNPSTLTMLTDLEAKLEELLTEIEQMPEDYVEKAEKAKEKERRDRVRGERLLAQQEAYAKKLEISMRRSRQPPKPQGKPVMAPSKPLFRRKRLRRRRSMTSTPQICSTLRNLVKKGHAFVLNSSISALFGSTYCIQETKSKLDVIPVLVPFNLVVLLDYRAILSFCALHARFAQIRHACKLDQRHHVCCNLLGSPWGREPRAPHCTL